mmetsp:Transcript_24753/g.62363  ORF Transcript_24753/g.62363 Transcript_24753/m.62363 type:complete len:93 (+) Transcript_24753:185-463(+)|eukprot:jgi/Tetstr1/453757/TSEL_040709.t1
MASSAVTGGLRSALAPLRASLLPRAAQAAGRRGMAAEAGEAAKVNMWEAPTDIARWKEEHTVLFILGCWGVVITTSLKVFGGKKEEPKAAAK